MLRLTEVSITLWNRAVERSRVALKDRYHKHCGGSRPGAAMIALPTLIFAVLAVSASARVSAQSSSDTASTRGDAVMEEVIVTGTRIARRDFASPSPISTVDQLFLDFSGQPTLEEALNQMPQVQPDFGRTSNNPGDGTARINLRGLGAERTLVMLNGRRLAPSGAGSAVDVNNLPQALIKRVEIITGGASAVYGSDAIAGVVNVITDDEFDGFSLEASYYSTEVGDSEIGDLNLVFGHNFADGRGNITVYGSYLDRKESFASDREISRVPLAEDLQGGLQPRGSSAIPEGFIFAPALDIGNGPEPTRFDEAGGVVYLCTPGRSVQLWPCQLPANTAYPLFGGRVLRLRD